MARNLSSVRSRGRYMGTRVGFLSGVKDRSLGEIVTALVSNIK